MTFDENLVTNFLLNRCQTIRL